MSENSIGGDNAPESLRDKVYKLLDEARKVGNSRETGLALPGVRTHSRTTRTDALRQINFLQEYISKKKNKKGLKSGLKGER